MDKTVEKAKALFDSIICLRVEGVEFYTSTEILEAILTEAKKGYDLCKESLKVKNSCRLCQPGYGSINNFCPNCERPLRG